MHHDLIQDIEQNPIIASVKTEAGLIKALASSVSTIFILHSNLFTVKKIVDRVKNANKSVFLHLDFMEGLARDRSSLDYIAKEIKPDGILSTKTNDIKYLNEKGIFTIQRFFLIDNHSLDSAVRTAIINQPCMIEIMPAIIPNIISQIHTKLKLPIIAGGLIQSKEDIIKTLSSGALGVSVGKSDFWVL